MRTITKLKSLLWDNDLAISLNNGFFEIIVTNKKSRSSHYVKGRNWTEVSNKAISDTKAASSNNTLNF
jgi:hypothetical protein